MKLLGSLVRIGVLVAAALFPSVANTEPIRSGALRISTGSADFDWTDLFNSFELAGSDFRLLLVSGTGASPGFPQSGGRVNPSLDDTIRPWGQFRVGEQTWTLPDPGAWTFSYRIIAPDVVPVIGEDFGAVDFPFRFAATLTSTATGGAFSYDFVGQGTGGWFTDSALTYVRFGGLGFTDAAPIPEPSTLVLLAAAAALSRCRRRHVTRSLRGGPSA